MYHYRHMMIPETGLAALVLLLPPLVSPHPMAHAPPNLHTTTLPTKILLTQAFREIPFGHDNFST